MTSCCEDVGPHCRYVSVQCCEFVEQVVFPSHCMQLKAALANALQRWRISSVKLPLGPAWAEGLKRMPPHQAVVAAVLQHTSQGAHSLLVAPGMLSTLMDHGGDQL